MAGMTVNEGSHGLKRRKYRPARGGEGAVEAREPSSRTRTPGNEETRVRESTAREEAA